MTRTSWHRRPLWHWIVGGLVLLCLGLASPIVWWDIVFDPSILIGRTPAAVLARCGEPDFASVTGAAAQDTYDTKAWAMMSQATRDRLVAEPEFMFGYRSWIGDQRSVRFKDGKVVKIEKSSK